MKFVFTDFESNNRIFGVNDDYSLKDNEIFITEDEYRSINPLFYYIDTGVLTLKTPEEIVIIIQQIIAQNPNMYNTYQYFKSDGTLAIEFDDTTGDLRFNLDNGIVGTSLNTKKWLHYFQDDGAPTTKEIT